MLAQVLLTTELSLRPQTVWSWVMSFCLMYFVWGIRGVKKSKRHRWIEQLQKGWAHCINSTVAAFLCGITESSLQVFVYQMFLLLREVHLRTLLRKHQGSVNALSDGWNFILPRTETNAFQFESRFLILSNFSSLHYFKKFPFKLPKWESDPFTFSTYCLQSTLTSIFSTFTAMAIFPLILIANRFCQHTGILDDYKDACTDWKMLTPALWHFFFFLQDIGMKTQHYKMSCWVWPMAYCPRVQTKNAVLKLPSLVLTSFQSWASKLSQWVALAL